MRGCATIITDCRLLRHFLKPVPTSRFCAITRSAGVSPVFLSLTRLEQRAFLKAAPCTFSTMKGWTPVPPARYLPINVINT